MSWWAASDGYKGRGEEEYGRTVVPRRRIVPAMVRSEGAMAKRALRRVERRAKKLGFESAGDRFRRDSLFRHNIETCGRQPEALREGREYHVPPRQGP